MKTQFASLPWLLSMCLLAAACGNNQPAPASQTTPAANPVATTETTKIQQPPEGSPGLSPTIEPQPAVENVDPSNSGGRKSMQPDPSPNPILNKDFILIRWRGNITINGTQPASGQPIMGADKVTFHKNSDLMFLADTSKATYWMHPDPFVEDPNEAALCGPSSCTAMLEPAPTSGAQHKKVPTEFRTIDRSVLVQLSTKLVKHLQKPAPPDQSTMKPKPGTAGQQGPSSVAPTKEAPPSKPPEMLKNQAPKVQNQLKKPSGQ